MTVVFFVIFLWYSGLFFQTFFLHRYAAHQTFTMSRFAEKVCFFLTSDACENITGTSIKIDGGWTAGK